MIVKNEFFLVATERSQKISLIFTSVTNQLVNKCNKECIEQNKESNSNKVKND